MARRARSLRGAREPLSPVVRALRKFGIRAVKDAPQIERPTYGDLAAFVGAGTQARRNRAILRDWVAFRRKKNDDLVCDVMIGRSPAQWVKAHAQFMRLHRRKDRISKPERRIALRTIRTSAMQMSARADHPIQHSQWEQLRSYLYINRERLFAGVRKSEIPYNFEGWLRGETYCFLEKSRPKLARIERHLGIEEGTFLSHSRRPAPKRAIDLGGKTKACL